MDAMKKIGMDGKLSEIGESNGGTGKSIYGFAIEKVIPQFYVDATRKDVTEDKFIWDGLTEKADSVFVDDVRTNFDFKIFLASSTSSSLQRDFPISFPFAFKKA